MAKIVSKPPGKPENAGESDELALKAQELAIRREEANAKISVDRRNLLWASPILLAFIGLLGTGVGAILQGYWNTKLERQKFEFSLIQKALGTSDKNEAALSLTFLAEAGLISEVNVDKIRTLAKTPQQLPIFLGAAIRDHLISVSEAKTILKHLGVYDGAINDEADDAFRKAVISFQSSKGMAPDGLIGPTTLGKFMEAWPDHFKSKQQAQP